MLALVEVTIERQSAAITLQQLTIMKKNNDIDLVRHIVDIFVSTR